MIIKHYKRVLRLCLLTIAITMFLECVFWRGYHEFVPHNYNSKNPIAILVAYDHGEISSPSNHRAIHVYVSASAGGGDNAYRLWITEYSWLSGKTIVWEGPISYPFPPPTIRWLDDNRIVVNAISQEQLKLDWRDRNRKHTASVVELPNGVIWPSFTINTIFYAVILWMLWLSLYAMRQFNRRKRGLCIKCCYNLRGAFEQGCPECGWGREAEG